MAELYEVVAFGNLSPKFTVVRESSLPRRDDAAGEVAAVDEQYAFCLEGMAQGLDAGGEDGFAGFETGDGATADAGGIGQVLERPVERCPRHAALDNVQFGTRVAKRSCTFLQVMALAVP